MNNRIAWLLCAVLMVVANLSPSPAQHALALQCQAGELACGDKFCYDPFSQVCELGQVCPKGDHSCAGKLCYNPISDICELGQVCPKGDRSCAGKLCYNPISQICQNGAVRNK
jgi:hypothetical protein